MPRVPVVDETLGAPRGARPAQPAFLRPPAAAPGLGRGLNVLAGSIAEVAENEKRKADRTFVLNAEGELAGIEQELRDRAQTMRGMNAAGALDLGDELDGAVGRLMESAHNDEQRELLQRVGLQRTTRFRSFASTYSRSEMDRAHAEAVKAKQGLAVRDAVQAIEDGHTDQAQAIVEDAVGLLQEDSDDLGDAPEVTEAKEAHFRSQAWFAAVGRLITQERTSAARDLYEATKDQIQPDERNRIETALGDLTAKEEKFRHVDRAWEFAKADGSLDRALGYAREKVPVEHRDAVEAELRERWADEERAQRSHQDGVFNRNYEGIERGMIRFDDLSVFDTRQMRPSQVDGLRVAQGIVDRKDPVVATDHDRLWREWYSKPLSDRAAIDVRELFPFLTAQDREQLMRESASIRAALDTAARRDPDQTRGVLTFQQTLRGLGIETGFLKNDGKAKDPELWSRFTLEAGRRVNDRQDELKRKLTDDELQTLLGGMLENVVRIDGWFGNPEVPASTVTFDQVGQVFADPPDPWMEDLRRFTAFKMNRPAAAVTDGDVRKVYGQLLIEMEVERDQIEQALRARNMDASSERVLLVFLRQRGILTPRREP